MHKIVVKYADHQGSHQCGMRAKPCRRKRRVVQRATRVAGCPAQRGGQHQRKSCQAQQPGLLRYQQIRAGHAQVQINRRAIPARSNLDYKFISVEWAVARGVMSPPILKFPLQLATKRAVAIRD